MAKLYATIVSERGKEVGMSGNDYLDIDIKVGNHILAALTVRQNENGDYALFDEDDTEIKCRDPRGNGRE